LQIGGRVAGLLFDKEFVEGPPFGGSKAAYEKLFAEKFHIKTMEGAYNSIPPRQGSELFFIAEKKR
jgi:thiopurine S-methyltransferase